MSDIEDENDEVIFSVDAFISQQLSQNLCLCQYPVTIIGKPADQELSKVRVKAKSRILEVDVPIPQDHTYSKEKGLMYGNAGISGSPESERTLKMQTYASHAIQPETSYMIGVIRNNEIHLTPVSHTYQLRPSFRYLDKIDAANKMAQKLQREEATKVESVEKKPKESRFLGLTAKSSDQAQAPRRNTYLHQLRQAEEEEWVELQYCNERSEEANAEYGQMFAFETVDLECITSGSEYVDMISFASTSE